MIDCSPSRQIRLRVKKRINLDCKRSWIEKFRYPRDSLNVLVLDLQGDCGCKT